MTTPGSAAGDGSSRPKKRPWGWIGLAAVLGVVAIGLGIYAVQVNSDLDDAEATVAQQEQALSEAQAAGGDAREAVASVVSDLATELGATQDDVAALEQQVNEAADSFKAAEEEVSAAVGELQVTEAERDAAQAKVEVVQKCAQSVVSAFSGVLDAETPEAGIEDAAAELRSLQPECAPAISD
jgi:chromosome segregation ATPase